MFGSIRKFTRDRRGAFAMQFALMAVPLCVCTGLAVDGGRAFLARFELASALDAAALAVGSTKTEGADLNAVAQKYVDINFKTEHDQPIKLELVVNDDKAVLKGSVEINTYFMPLVGQPTVKIAAESEVRVGGNNVEVAMALDITGSMNTTRINGLKAASKILIDEVVNTVQTPYFSKIAIVPWSESVYPGTKHVDASTPVALRGTPTPSTPITGAAWRRSGTSIQTIKSAGWRTNTGIALSTYAWKNGGTATTSLITKTDSNTRVRIRFNTTDPGFAEGEAIYMTSPTGGYTNLKNTPYKLVGRVANSSPKSYDYWLQQIGTSTYVPPPTTSAADGTTATIQRCLTTMCELVFTANDHKFSNGDFIYVTGISTKGSGATPNNTWGTTYVAGSVTTNTFVATGTNGPAMLTYNGNGTASKCYVSDCKYRIETNADHGFNASDTVFMWGLSEGATGKTLITAANASMPILNPTGSVFYMANTSATFWRVWNSGGYVAACANTTCNVDVTSNNHGIASGDRVEISGVGGMTALNRSDASSSSRRTWATTLVSSNVFRLKDSTPALDASMQSDYQSNTGAAQCLTYGCAKLFASTGSSASTVPYMVTPCLVERYGADAATDVSPAAVPLGMYYTANGTCTTTNYVTPLTADRDRLNTSIDDLKTGGSTAGQIGIAWAWYLLSPNFKDVWTKEAANEPKIYPTKELVKVAVLMTDGEFNFSTCKGVTSGTLCNATDEFDQAQAICTAMKLKKIVIYTVGLQLTDATAKSFLAACATDKTHAYLAADTTELQVAFKKIATSISKLRISK